MQKTYQITKYKGVQIKITPKKRLSITRYLFFAYYLTYKRIVLGIEMASFLCFTRFTICKIATLTLI